MIHWKEYTVSPDNTHFLHSAIPVFNRQFIEVLKFHEPGLAPVLDESGAFHINASGEDLYATRYKRTFGYYCHRAAVISNEGWFHIDINGTRVYNSYFEWAGNYQENKAVVRDNQHAYYHIDLNGQPIYTEQYVYAGDYKDGIACVKLSSGYFTHIDEQGKPVHNKIFNDLGVYHKNYATACDHEGWFHINKLGMAIYQQRYLAIEPFYNGFALVTTTKKQKRIINEDGKEILSV